MANHYPIDRWRTVASAPVYHIMREAGYSASLAFDAARADATGDYLVKVEYDPDYSSADMWDDSVPELAHLMRVEETRLESGEYVARYVQAFRRCECCGSFGEPFDSCGGIVDGYGGSYAEATGYEMIAFDYRDNQNK